MKKPTEKVMILKMT